MKIPLSPPRRTERALGSALLLGLVWTTAAPAQTASLEPFAMPWDDAAAGITSLAGWQPGEAGAEGWVRVDGSQYRDGAGRRIRFLGVNVTAGGAFPSAAQAEGHAARLARFGFNGVRFHHMEAPWDKSRVLVDYSRGGSRELSAERLDRLHYFVAQLARNGIYSNLNLLVSREFQPSDGLGVEIARMGWKDQHILGFFHDGALELHKEYARKLLTAPNPHRGGRPLAEDPAVAFVEIMNENGMVQKWFEGVVDGMPAVYRDVLSARWNQWLAARYDSTAAMLAAWRAINEPLGQTRLNNGSFANGPAGWNFERHEGAAATAVRTDEFQDGGPALRVEVTTPGTANWHVQLNQAGLSLEREAPYTFSFWAKASANGTPLAVAVQRAHTDYAAIGFSATAQLTTEWRRYSATFQATVTEGNARFNFGGFGDRRVTVWIAGAEFLPGGRVGGVPEGATLEDRTVPVLARSTPQTVDHRRDWFRFLLELEKNYWDEMRRYVTAELGYQGIVLGTIVANSPPNAQAGLDAMDSHAYWQHPVFPPGLDFNAEQWTVQNVSMVNHRTGGVLGDIARQRVAGKPHNVTELQFCSPNFYAAEGPLLAAAYAGLQDWDSLWFFEYRTDESEFVSGFFDHGGHPARMVNNLLAAALFRRGDVAPAVNGRVFAFDAETELNMAATRGAAWYVAHGAHLGVPPALALLERLALVTSPGDTPPAPIPAAPTAAVLASDTAELKWDNSINGRGVVTIDTARTKAVVGFSARRRFDLGGGVRIEPATPRLDWSTIGLTLLEGSQWDGTAPARGVLAATGEWANTGMEWKDATRTSVGSRWGRAPVLVETVAAVVTLPAPASRVSVWALDARGARVAEVPVTEGEGGAARVELGRTGATLWYEFAIAGPAAP